MAFPAVFTSRNSGFLAARRACEAVFDAFLKSGGQYRQAQPIPGRVTANRMEAITVTGGSVLKADIYLFAPGPWLGRVFSFLESSITPTRQEVFFFGTPAGDVRFTEEHLPTWIDGGKRSFSVCPETIGGDSRLLTIPADR
jgi:sarcosine oxidase